MEFGPVPTSSALGAILAHSVQANGKRLRKGLVLEQSHLYTLVEAGKTEVTVARLAAEDVHEDDAALALALALVPDEAAAYLRLGAVGTGRCNIFATAPGVVQIDADAINALNAIHPMITVATVPQQHRMEQGGMVATVKIISYAVPKDALARTLEVGKAALRVAVASMERVSFIETTLANPMSSKGANAIRDRVEALGARMDEPVRCAHDISALSDALRRATGDMVLILTASATSDLRDIAPEAVRTAGGKVAHFGMPVDPGNLLFLGDLAGKPVIGLPGCARSPALNGADWVLERLICGIPVTAKDIMGMGVGGLLKEIPSRPQPRDPKRT
ncbi:molybdenum cofactor cytidylyltransferase [Litoreibacter ascidiaceicola]|uniref:Molybdenum cofactor cytidylyltransferase n=1 Tax=Litoreibacter ascidiaceicola TaxID=1486859 RepID=A0A1M4VFG8_9RHOB|nr:molybdopterin-binding protein [Litoreibacter ascidiaceicola]SHE67642.1 molybdenum cofactor cytidylyltransferase [Litoreibacter ascidiaceicola]